MKENFSEGIWGFLISCLLFITLLLVNQCSNPETDMYIPAIKSHQSWFYIPIIGLFVIQQVMVRWPRRASLGDVNYLKKPIVESLKYIHKQYYAEVSGKNSGTQGHPLVNANIMLPTWSGLKCFLKIYYSFPHPYPDKETELKWKSGEGTCGYAWAMKSEVIYDSVNPEYKAPGERLKPHHTKVVGDIKSVLSIPIWDRQSKKVIGILNLDSNVSNIDKTYFNDRDILEIIAARAHHLSPLLESFYNGVRTQ